MQGSSFVEVLTPGVESSDTDSGLLGHDTAAGTHGTATRERRTGRVAQVCVFELAGTQYGLDVSVVSEVFTPDLTTPVPLAPAAFVGLCNLRGTALAIVDCAAALGLTNGGQRQDGTSPVLVLRFPDLTVGVTIERVLAVRSFHESEVTPSSTSGADDPVLGFLVPDSNTQSATVLLRPDYVRQRLEAIRLHKRHDARAETEPALAN